MHKGKPCSSCPYKKKAAKPKPPKKGKGKCSSCPHKKK